MIQDIVGTAYLLWPMTVLAFIIVFIAGFLFAISLGGLFAIGLLISYYIYVYLRKRGIFDKVFAWLETKHTVVGKKLRENIGNTFVLKGDLNQLPNGPVLYVAHPHGLFSMAPFLHWAAEVTSWQTGRKVHIAIHSIFFRIPLVRELCEHFGAIEATDDGIREVLKKGDSVALLTGGIREVASTSPGRMQIFLKKRKGFARIAKDLGIPIVPVLTFGENELFPPIQGFWTDWVQSYLRSWFGLAIPLPTLESFWNWFQLLRGPLSHQVETWIGEPVSTDEKKSIETIRKHIFLGFEHLYKKGRPIGYPRELEIL